MTILGEIRRGNEIGKNTPNHYIWHACISCGKQRWVGFVAGRPRNSMCYSCAHKKPFKRSSEGYIYIMLQPDDFFYPMANCQKYVSEHRLVMARYLKRCLLPWEVVHHINGIKGDNRLENLRLLPTHQYHLIDSVAKSYMVRLERKIDGQTKQIRLLQWQIAQLTKEESNKWVGNV